MTQFGLIGRKECFLTDSRSIPSSYVLWRDTEEEVKLQKNLMLLQNWVTENMYLALGGSLLISTSPPNSLIYKNY